MNDFVRNTIIGTIVVVLAILLGLLAAGLVAVVGWLFGENAANAVMIMCIIVFLGALIGSTLDD